MNSASLPYMLQLSQSVRPVPYEFCGTQHTAQHSTAHSTAGHFLVYGHGKRTCTQQEPATCSSTATNSFTPSHSQGKQGPGNVRQYMRRTTCHSQLCCLCSRPASRERVSSNDCDRGHGTKPHTSTSSQQASTLHEPEGHSQPLTGKANRGEII
jgi:hypothetical protein